MNYIVMDLEWNQSSTGQEAEAQRLPFEIIEIGAIQLNDGYAMINQFNELIKPQVYHELNEVTGQLMHMEMEELNRGKPFFQVVEAFLKWCGEQPYLFCTWGVQDLTELQRNMKFYNMAPLSDGPIAFLDVQKLFGIAYEDRKTKRSLEYAIDYLQIEKDIPFHRAFSDAYYTAKIFSVLAAKSPELLRNVSYDVFNPPRDRKQEIKTQFDTYMKYISRQFDDREEMMADREVSSSKCYLCHRNLRKKLKWFSANGRHYYCVAYCEKHGYLKGKIRVRKTDEGKYYAVKTTKFITKEEADAIALRRDHIRELRRKHRHKGEGKA